jgi:hypothetical protein
MRCGTVRRSHKRIRQELGVLWHWPHPDESTCDLTPTALNTKCKILAVFLRAYPMSSNVKKIDREGLYYQLSSQIMFSICAHEYKV